VNGVNLQPDTVVARSGEPLTATIDDELVMLDPRQGVYFALDTVGHRVWELLEQPCSVDELCRTLGEEFDVDAATCRGDVLAFLGRLSEAELLEVR
jgi:hypothetical protein